MAPVGLAVLREAPGFDPATGDWLPAEGEGSVEAGWDPEAPKRTTGAVVWHVVLGVDLSLLGLLLGASAYLAVTGKLDPAQLTAPSIGLSTAISLVLMGLVPFLWAAGTRRGGTHGAMHYLGLENPAPNIVRGILLGLGCVAGLALVGEALCAVYTPTSSKETQAILAVMTFPLAAFMSLSAGLGEEILFRGLLQRWLGVWGQAALFAFAHLDYGTVWQVAIPFALGLLFGYLVRRGVRLWVVIAAHATFDFVQFALALLVPHLGC